MQLKYICTGALAAAALLIACGAEELEEPQADAVEYDVSDQPLYVFSTKLWPNPVIPICWDVPRDTDYLTERGWVRDALERTWEAVSKVDFTGWAKCPSGAFAGVRVTVSDEQPKVTAYGRDLSNRVGGVKLNFTFLNYATSCQGARREACIRVDAVHELGHALGFNHEQDRPDGGACPRQTGTSATDKIMVDGYDADSVMNYCNARYTQKPLMSF